MCTEPQTHEGLTFACRKCNECISARKNDWVARACAEKAMSTETVVIDLTYRNQHDGTKPPGARAFNYAHVKAFLDSLRSAYYRHYGSRSEISFIIAGERGSNKDRVHWHLVIFSSKPVTILGKWQDFWFRKIRGITLERMIHWSFWPHGHVYCQTPDQGGIAYVMKYALKDQFNNVQSKGTMRESKSENHGASYFRMSKRPPIGQRYLDKVLSEWEATLTVPINTLINIPEYSGYWWPKGKQREYYLQRLHEINERCKKETGRNAPQWTTLLQSVVSNIKDWEALQYGEIEEIEENSERFEREIKTKQAEAETAYTARKIRERCGNRAVCKPCWRGFGRKQKADFQNWYEAQAATADEPRGCNPWCQLKHLEQTQRAFIQTQKNKPNNNS